MSNREHLARIRWNCRRGMLELDVILQKFFDRHYLLLSETEQKQFEKLLMCYDQELFNWLLGAEQPEDLELKLIVLKIRANSFSMWQKLEECNGS